MKIFFDTEFNGLVPNTELLSIGFVAENGMKCYVELDTLNIIPHSDWIQENVFDRMMHNCWKHPIPPAGYELAVMKIDSSMVNKDRKALSDPCIFDGVPINVAENPHVMRTVVESYLTKFDQVELVSDVCHYDMVLLCNLFGGAFELPKNVTPACHDINQDIAYFFGISQQEAFDYSREKILTDIGNSMVSKYGEEFKHSALYDAIVIKEIYEYFRGDKRCI